MWKKLLKQLNLSDSYISMGLGLLVVLGVGVLLFNYFSSKSQPSISTSGEQTQTEEEALGELPNTHKVVANETLWSISEKYYKSGYNWVDIAKANNLVNPNVIEEGTTLNIPEVTKDVVSSETVQKPEVPDSYTVKPADSLWKIAVTVYNDGYKWLEIARINNLDNPNIIHTGNILKLPR